MRRLFGRLPCLSKVWSKVWFHDSSCKVDHPTQRA
jgi:hypothetical protein